MFILILQTVYHLFSGLKGTGGLARAWVVAFNEDPTSLAHDNIFMLQIPRPTTWSYIFLMMTALTELPKFLFFFPWRQSQAEALEEIIASGNKLKTVPPKVGRCLFTSGIVILCGGLFRIYDRCTIVPY